MENMAKIIYTGRAMRNARAASRHAEKGDLISALHSMDLAQRNLRRADNPPKLGKRKAGRDILSSAIKTAARREIMRDLTHVEGGKK